MSTTHSLNDVEARILGVLVEKEATTPDQYPLSPNGVAAGANQKSNREPPTDFSGAVLHVGLQGLMAKGLAGRTMPAGSRVEKWHHTARQALELSQPELAVLAELLMRGPQAPGELRQRASRMAALPTLEALQDVLGRLIAKSLARRLEPLAGSRSERYVQTLAAGLHPEVAPAASAPAAAPAARTHAPDRLGALEARVERMEQAMRDLGALD